MKSPLSFGVFNRLKRTIGLLGANLVFRGQITRKQRRFIEGFCIPTYFLSPIYPEVIQRATRLIERDERAAEVVREYVRAVVEIESEAQMSELGSSGMPIGACYFRLPSEPDSELAEVSFACALVHFAVYRKLLLRLSERCPKRHDSETEKRIKRISLTAMHAFTVRAELGERYSYEIECKLKNGAYGC